MNRISARLFQQELRQCTCLPARRTLITAAPLARPPKSSPNFDFAAKRLLGSKSTIPFASQRALFRSYAKARFQSTPRQFSNADAAASIGAASAAAAGDQAGARANPVVSRYLFVIAGMVFSIVIVGGMTRLTESGLSITEWNLITGVLPPLNDAEWQSEFDKYKLSPEWRIQNQHISMNEFKRIYYWEWGHRVLGRAIGLAFLLPIPYFTYRRFINRRTGLALFGIGSLIGAQGAMGWYMVKSGLDDKSIQQLGGVPRVSQYRLAAHLGMAFLVYVSCLRLGLGIARDSKLLRGLPLGGAKDVQSSLALLQSPQAKRLRLLSLGVAGLVFLTAISGAFVAGLDAGLIYNDFPYMGGQLVPPANEIYNDSYARKADKSDKWWRNMLENPTTTQFDHRVLAMTTFTSIVSLFLYARRPSIRSNVPPATLRLIKGTMHMSFLQVALGISTLWYLVPTHLAATHQAGSLVLLSLAVAAATSLRRPAAAIRQLNHVRASAGTRV